MFPVKILFKKYFIVNFYVKLYTYVVFKFYDVY